MLRLASNLQSSTQGQPTDIKVGFNLVWCLWSVFLHFLKVEKKKREKEFYRMQDVQKFNSFFLLQLFICLPLLFCSESTRNLNDFLQFVDFWETQRVCWKLPKINSRLFFRGVIRRCKVNHDISSHRCWPYSGWAGMVERNLSQLKCFIRNENKLHFAESFKS